MTTEIKTWQIVDDKLKPLKTSLAAEGKSESYDLEEWIVTDASILGSGLAIIGRQVATKSGRLDLLAIDRSGNLVVVELKRDKLPRDVLAQAIDYASDVAMWSVDKIGEVCVSHAGKELDEHLSDSFPDIDVASLNINEAQRILLVGFGVESSLERMISWLSSSYGVSVNAVVLHYTRTSHGDELLTKTAIISEELEQELALKHKIQIVMSDEPGDYERDELERMLIDYLSQDYKTTRVMRDIMLPFLLERGPASRPDLVEELAAKGVETPGHLIANISRLLGIARNDFLRQVIGYEYPTHEWEKDNYQVRDGYKKLVAQVLASCSELEPAHGGEAGPLDAE